MIEQEITPEKKEELKSRSYRLTAISNLFDPFWPDGKKDFRGMVWPSAWRGGTFANVSSSPEKWKVLLGCPEDANKVRDILIANGFSDATIVLPHSIQLEGEGETPSERARTSWYQVRFTMPEVWL